MYFKIRLFYTTHPVVLHFEINKPAAKFRDAVLSTYFGPGAQFMGAFMMYWFRPKVFISGVSYTDNQVPKDRLYHNRVKYGMGILTVGFVVQVAATLIEHLRPPEVLYPPLSAFG